MDVSQRHRGRTMVIPPTAPAVTRRPARRQRGAMPRRRPRVPVPIRIESEAPPTIAAAIFPAALQDLLKALPPEARLSLEALAPLVVQRTPLANATLML